MKSIYDKIWKSALRKIQIRPMSTFELRQKLGQKFPDDRGLILKVTGEMERVELLNDRRFAEQYLAHLTQKAIGRIKIMAETRKKGLKPEVVGQILLNMGWSEEESCKLALEKKQKTLTDSDPGKRKLKLVNFLRSRGFKDAVIYRLLRVLQ